MVRGRLFVFIVVVVMGAAVGGGLWLLDRSSGRTPSSAVLNNVYGDAVVFDRTFDGQGSSEDNTRVVVLASEEEPSSVVREFTARAGWRRLGKGAIRTSDGLCIVPYSSAEYLEGSQQGVEDVRAVTEGRAAVVISLLYC